MHPGNRHLWIRRRSANPPNALLLLLFVLPLTAPPRATGVNPRAVSVREAAVAVVASDDELTAARRAALLLADAVIVLLFMPPPPLPFRAADFKAETMDARMDSGLEGGVSG